MEQKKPKPTRFNFDRDWGVVRLDMAGDTAGCILAGMMVAMTKHHRLTHFLVIPITDGGSKGATRLELHWTDSGKGNPLPFPLETPQEAADFVRKWLEKQAEWPDNKPDTDGDVEAGFLIRAGKSTGEPWACAVVVTPAWMVYGK